MNRVILIGNLVADPELKTTQSGIACAQFRIAVQRRYTNAQGARETDFISCVAWRQTAEFICRHFIKGNKIAIEGMLQVRSFDAQDGTKRYVTEVVVDNAEFVTPKGSQKEAQARADMNGFTEVDSDELPF